MHKTPASLRSAKTVLSVVFSCALMACATTAPQSHPSAVTNCQPFENTQPICKFSNPEDLALVPGSSVLIVSEFGDYHGTQPGALVFYDYATQQRRIAYDGRDTHIADQVWGDASCLAPPGEVFSPHGIDLSRRTDGRWQLLVIQHGGRESVEFFELIGVPDNLRLIWRGCAIAPGKASLNSVAAIDGGSMFVTNMQSIDSSWQGDADAPEPATGRVYRWHKTTGFEQVPGSRGSMPNGIAATRDGSSIFVAYSGENRIRKLDASSGAVLAERTVPAADNLKWSADGSTLLAASFTGSQDSAVFAACTLSAVGVCPIDFAIVALAPATLATQILFENGAAPMGAGTVGLKIGSDLFIGTFSGNRILRVDLGVEHE